ncbi:META domain-containing protein [Streptomyces sp. NPDC001288]|uniref:META domain-containing protein n=1 Tax=Streptomyces sp. NPDC001297 TaxID=3364559 RepID=UPI0036A5FCC0
MTATAVLVPLAVACGGERAGESVASRPAVTGIEWTVARVTADGTTRDAPSRAHLRIDGGRAAGGLGCNQFSATARITDDRIRLGGLRTTRMACDGARTAFERALAGVLTAGPLATRADGRELTLTAADGDRVELVRK